MNRIISFFLMLFTLVSSLFGRGTEQPRFKNEYALPDELTPYTRLDTEPKTDWKAYYIRDDSDPGEENVWRRYRKTADLKKVPGTLNAYISADSKYVLYINGETAVIEGGVKRGPTPEDSYYDTVDIAPYLKPGKNVICALCWYWGKDKSFSHTDSGEAGFIFEAGDIISDGSWKVRRNEAFLDDRSLSKPNYRLPESNIYYDARKEAGDWLSPDFDDGEWENAVTAGKGGCAPWGRLYPRGIPMLKDFGLKDYEDSGEYKNLTTRKKRYLTLNIPYNAQCAPYFKIDAKAGKKIRIITENTWLGAVSDIYITKDGVQEFEPPGWFNGQRITYVIPRGVKILELKYRETGYDAAFSGAFESGDERLDTLWQKSLRTLYVTMRDNYMDCPDRERAQWWGDVTNETAMSMYALDPGSYLLYQKGAASMLGHIDKNTKVMQTVVPIGGELFELPVQMLAGISGFMTYYTYTGDRDFLKTVYDASVGYVGLWSIGDDGLAAHREGSWDWMDWGRHADVTAIENAWYYTALSAISEMAEILGKDSGDIRAKMSRIEKGYQSLWTGKGYKSRGVSKPDDRANALAVLSGLAGEDKYDAITEVLTQRKNSSPYMEYYVLEALCRMERFDEAKSRMLDRYEKMINDPGSTLWEKWNKWTGTQNHAWSGGPLVIMSKYFAGVRPAKPGYDEFVIQPQMSVSGAIKCVVPSVKGYIRVDARKTGEGFSLDAEIPGGAAAKIYLPRERGQTVYLNGETIYRDREFTATAGISFVEEKDGVVVFSAKAEENLSLSFRVTGN